MQNEMVVKSNNLIRKTRYQLTEQEQKIIIYLISQIDINDKETKTITMTTKKYIDLLGINSSGINYERIKDSIKNLSNKSWWIPIEEHKELLFRWVDTAIMEKGNITIRLSSSLEPYIIGLKENFTQYELINALVLKSKYSIRLYELFKSYLWQHSWTIDIEELKEILNCNSYNNLFKEFNRNVIKKSIDEINKYTDLNITTNYIKQGRNVISLQFNISEKKGWENCIDMITNRNKRLKK